MILHDKAISCLCLQIGWKKRQLSHNVRIDFQVSRLAAGPSGHDWVGRQPFLHRPFLSVGLAISPSASRHPSSQRHVQAKGQGQEQDRMQAALLRRVCTQNQVVSGRARHSGNRLYWDICPAIFSRKSARDFVKTKQLIGNLIFTGAISPGRRPARRGRYSASNVFGRGRVDRGFLLWNCHII